MARLAAVCVYLGRALEAQPMREGRDFPGVLALTHCISVARALVDCAGESRGVRVGFFLSLTFSPSKSVLPVWWWMRVTGARGLICPWSSIGVLSRCTMEVTRRGCVE